MPQRSVRDLLPVAATQAPNPSLRPTLRCFYQTQGHTTAECREKKTVWGCALLLAPTKSQEVHLSPLRRTAAGQASGSLGQGSKAPPSDRSNVRIDNNAKRNVSLKGKPTVTTAEQSTEAPLHQTERPKHYLYENFDYKIRDFG